MADLIGRTLGPYQIRDEIGRGGMADVYLAVQPSIGRQVAIKVLSAHLLQDQTFVERFAREVQVIARLQHPHILPVYDFGEENGLYYIVMAYMPGGTLSERIHREGALPLDEVTRLTEQIASGLDFAHEKGIIHRDFKPSNVLLDEKGNVYLADFGIAKMTEAAAQLTGSGIVGTPAYMAPEMARQGGVTPLIDVYALGVTVFEMLAGHHPYQAETPVGIMMAHSNEPVPDVREAHPELPDAVQTIIERAMEKDPRRRTQSAGELASELRAVVDAIGRGDLQLAASGTVPSTLPSLSAVPRSSVVEQPPAAQAPPDRPAGDRARPERAGAAPGNMVPDSYPRPPVIAQSQRIRRRSISPWVWIAGIVAAIAIVIGGLGVVWALWGWLGASSSGMTGSLTAAPSAAAPVEVGDMPTVGPTAALTVTLDVTEYPECPGAAKPRLKVGGKGRVTPGDPSTLWAGPNSEPALATLYEGTTFTILEGPVCVKARNGSLNTWRVQLENGRIGWLAEGYAGQDYWIEPVP